MMRIKADTGLCVGSSQCVLTEPTVFDQDADGIVTLLTDHPDNQSAAQVRHAVTLCPSRALLVPSGVSLSQASRRMRLIADAVSTAPRWVLSRPM